MTPEQKARKADYQRAHYATNAEKIAEHAQAYRAANAEKLTEAGRAYCAANAEKLAKKRRAYRATNAEKIGKGERAKCSALSDNYVCNMLRMPYASVPPELIELKRALLLGHRIQRSLKKEIENEPHRPNER